MIQNIIMKIYLINSSISRFINCLYCWIYISYTSHKNWKSYSGTRLALCFILRLKITVYLLSCFHSVYHSVSIVVTRCHFLLFVVTRCHSLSFIVTLCTTRFQSLSFIVSLVVIRCHSMYHSSFYIQPLPVITRRKKHLSKQVVLITYTLEKMSYAVASFQTE